MTTQREMFEIYNVEVERPEDFDDFWATTLLQTDTVPLNPSLEPVPLRSDDEVDVYEIHYDSYDGLRIAGWYCVPKASYLEPPYPGLSIVPGYISEPTLPKSWARQGYAAIGVAPRGKLRSNARFNPGYPGLLTYNIVDKETYGYRGFYMDACRAIDFLVDRPEVDNSRIGVHGSSQGGALTVVTTALKRDVIACGAAGAPYLCAFLDSARLTHSEPYEEINEYLRANPEDRERVRETLAYYDLMNFAPLITAPMFVYIGSEDDVCPPETGNALFKALTCEKELLISPPHCAHDAGIYWAQPTIEAFLAERLQPAGWQWQGEEGEA